MAKVSLRAYLREVESLINSGQYEEAAAHAQHIIQSYPKLVSAYRLLGKAYLESQRFFDAADILQRVLSAVPDDFVAHVGMSMIREDENNLHAAIWHMERAFEAQPYNAAIQNELRRLYGRRDGVEPAKVRLTRGALARMYARGHLYQQAISELRAALAEDHQRPDLQVLLARMYFLSGEKVDAVDVCSSLLKRLPFCLEANRILANILPETGRKEDAQIYSQRVGSLDPYLLHAIPASPYGDEVPENVAMIDKLEYLRSYGAGESPSQPAWAASLGVSVEEFTPKEDKIPDWLHEPAGKPEVAPFVEEEEPEKSEELIPDWMKEAGWQAGTGEAEGSEAYPEGEEGGIAPAEIPDWLQAMAPQEAAEETIDITFGEEMDTQEAEPPASLPEETPAFSGETVLDWRETGETGSGENQPVIEEGESLFENAEAQAEIPDWLKEMEAEQKPAEPEAIQPEETAEQPDWLQEVIPTIPSFKVEPSNKEIPGWEPETAPTEIAGPAEPEMEAVPDWLKELAVEDQPTVEVETPGETEQTLEQVEEALGDFEPVEPIHPYEESLPVELDEETFEAEQVETVQAELPDWLKEIAPPDLGFAEETQQADEAFDAFQEEAIEELEQLPSEEAPTLVAGVAEVSELEAEGEAPAAEVPLDEDAAMAWLESLAARQGVPEEELTTRPEERSEELPEWLEESIEGEPEAVEPEVGEALPAGDLPDWLVELAGEPPAVISEEVAFTEEASEEAAPEEVAFEEVEEVFAEVTPAEPELPAVEEPAVAGEIPDWLKEIEAEIPEEAPTEIGEAAATPFELPEIPYIEETLPEAEQPEGVPPFAVEEEKKPAPENVPVFAEPVFEEKPVAEPPDWLKDLQAETEEKAEPAEAAPASEAPMSEDEAMAWLESLAARQGVPEEELTTQPEERPAEAPAWAVEAADMVETEAVEEIGEEIPAPEEFVVPEELSAPEVETPQQAEAPVEQQAEEVELPSWILEAAEAPGEETAWTPASIPVPETVQQAAPVPEAFEPTVDINSGSLVDLESLPGIGFVLAQNILTFRDAKGKFSSVDDLVKVPGFSKELVDELRPYLMVQPEPQAQPEPEPALTPTAVEGPGSEGLEGARAALKAGNMGEALSMYESLIKKQAFLDEVLKDIDAALYRHPVDASLWQLLGDAYMRQDRLNEALEAYNKAEELIR